MNRDSPIFIGSSGERKRLAGRIAKELEKHQFHPLLWWKQEVFRAGDVLLDRLVQLSRMCGGAVLIFGGDDEVWSRGVASIGVRDNVLLEYGLFLGGCDREHTVIVAERDAKRPSDLDGITVVFFEDGKDTHSSIAKAVAGHFARLLREESRDFRSGPSIVIHMDWSMELHTITRAGAGWWSLASLYGGMEGALAWRAVESDPSYSKRVQTSEGGTQIGILVGKRKVSTVVSLGPGIGSVDVEVMANLRENRWREYVPVDVNQYLLLESARRVSEQNAMTESVRGILCDFDKNLSFVGDVVRRHTKGPRLFLMVGGTFGNSAQTEGALLRGLYAIMEPGDLFLFDLFCCTPGYEVQKDPLFSVRDTPLAVQEFFANGVRMMLGERSLNHEEAISRILPRESSGSLPGTKTVELVERDGGNTIVRIKRFVSTEINKAITEAGFEIVSPRKVSDGALERHIVLASSCPETGYLGQCEVWSEVRQ